ncbi:SAM-dependent methyltransferase [Roseimaritima sediminicola]|uniref:SAM-dependent methyltransferase n=1 Tax=Roseimaritima sediminicola TaxID=2662066 RepID=UPI001F3305D5|nr:SAM-dependent methyltransferase [Roseimaritima sediminicola]
MADASFLMVTCQRGAETALKNDLTAAAGWRLAFSRPGFVTFKHDSPTADWPDSPFARTRSHSVGKAQSDQLAELLDRFDGVLDGLADRHPGGFDHLHVWARDRAVVGEFSFEPHAANPLVADVAQRIYQHLTAGGRVAASEPNQTASRGQSVLDVVLVDPGQWWFGWHRAEDLPSSWPGAIPPVDAEQDVVSRAYFKLAEAVAWSQLPMRPGEHVFEIGSAPGGACQRLLELGFRVTGIDPAEMDPRVLEHRHMTHVQAHAEDLKRSVYRDARWLVVDATIKPQKTLWAVEGIVTSSEVSVRGMLLTLKLGSYERAEEIEQWTQRVRSWGYPRIAVRQLATGRREICLAASK